MLNVDVCMCMYTCSMYMHFVRVWPSWICQVHVWCLKKPNDHTKSQVYETCVWSGIINLTLFGTAKVYSISPLQFVWAAVFLLRTARCLLQCSCFTCYQNSCSVFASHDTRTARCLLQCSCFTWYQNCQMLAAVFLSQIGFAFTHKICSTLKSCICFAGIKLPDKFPSIKLSNWRPSHGVIFLRFCWRPKGWTRPLAQDKRRREYSCLFSYPASVLPQIHMETLTCFQSRA